MLLEEKTGPLLCRTHPSSPPAGVECCMTYLGTRYPNRRKETSAQGSCMICPECTGGRWVCTCGMGFCSCLDSGKMTDLGSHSQDTGFNTMDSGPLCKSKWNTYRGGGIEEQAQGVVRAGWTPSVARMSMGSRWYVLLKCIKIFMSVFINKQISIFKMSTWIIIS